VRGVCRSKEEEAEEEEEEEEGEGEESVGGPSTPTRLVYQSSEKEEG
jgi:hypothetical protein